ncbi:hypothetical protein GUITHDRAFT_111964 [Guillardia theta CCMP2712]|uniref:PROP1-like PPR domain-containing protein n=1 Tax=Guillardia theta (strain CCMP2712) TaxID=905079 RepID=L1J1B1_GUITC|nr:hypothetical protein GUITHDRAFT_111964 [Guillardia theta CCMP2712]EKX42112.1 hypothetical protein GUITHDRAFT_111964 [Guillardia theta CCMP2712]|eukprot:XP_005829092.1 hypothetical protein GUITHDRAFT_111964 [Guillardia theta CCMP2712]
MRSENYNFTLKFFTTFMSVCGQDIRRGRATADDAYEVLSKCKECGLQPDAILYNALMNTVAQAAWRGEAILSHGSQVISSMKEDGVQPDAYTFNTLLDVCTKMMMKQGRRSGAPVTPMTGFSVVQLMLANGVSPDQYTFTSYMQLCVKCAERSLASPRDGERIVEMMRSQGLAPSLHVYNTLLDLIAKCASHKKAELEDGERVLERMAADGIAPNLVTFNTLLECCANSARYSQGGLARAWGIVELLVDSKLSPDRFTLNALLKTCLHSSRSLLDPLHEGTEIFHHLCEHKGRREKLAGCDIVKPDLISFSILMSICEQSILKKRATIKSADLIIKTMKRDAVLQIDTGLCNSFLACACADGSEEAVESAEEMFDAIPAACRSSQTYGRMLQLHGRRGDAGMGRARALLEEAEQAGLVDGRLLQLLIEEEMEDEETLRR